MTGLVLDSSAVVEYVRGTGTGTRVAQRLRRGAGATHMPHLCAVEVVSALRGLVLGGKLEVDEARIALRDLAAIKARRHPAEALLPRVWALRNNLTAYDAVYVALAEALEATLLTSDRKLAPKYRHYADVEVIA